MAATLAGLVEQTAPLRDLPGLPHDLVPRDALWPAPHNALFDFEATMTGAASIDDRSLRRAERTSWLPPVPRSSGTAIGAPTTCASATMARSGVVYDWDSLAVGPEAVLVGGVASTFSVIWSLEVRKYPPPEVAAGFVRDYEIARGRRFDPAERIVIGAAAMQFQLHGTLPEHAGDPTGRPAEDSARVALRAYAPEVLAALLSDPTVEVTNPPNNR